MPSQKNENLPKVFKAERLRSTLPLEDVAPGCIVYVSKYALTMSVVRARVLRIEGKKVFVTWKWSPSGEKAFRVQELFSDQNRARHTARLICHREAHRLTVRGNYFIEWCFIPDLGDPEDKEDFSNTMKANAKRKNARFMGEKGGTNG